MSLIVVESTAGAFPSRDRGAVWPGAVSQTWTVALALAVALLAIASPVSAQAPGAVAGVVDVAGSSAQPLVVPGVTLTLTCPASPAGSARPAVRVAVTDADGAYRIQNVAPGSCSIIAELQGFQSTTTTVTIQEDHTVDVALRLGFNTLDEHMTSLRARLPRSGRPASRVRGSIRRHAGGRLPTTHLPCHSFPVKSASLNWHLQIDREWLSSLSVCVGYRQRHGG